MGSLNEEEKPMDVRAIVLEQIRIVAKENNKTLAPLTDQLPLIESGLDSLCIAILVANLEDQLGFDPFSAGDDLEVPNTLGDLIRAYENAAA
jgi:acyl carrier protein